MFVSRLCCRSLSFQVIVLSFRLGLSPIVVSWEMGLLRLSVLYPMTAMWN